MKKIILLLNCIVAVLIANAQAPAFQWAIQAGGPVYDIGYAVAADASGNVFTTGGFQGTVDFDPGPGTFNLTSGGAMDIFISKSDASGNLIWAKQIGGGTSDNNAYALTLDAAGNIYTTGHFQGTSDFDPGPSTFNLTGFGLEDIFISKLDASGNFVWAKQLGGTSGEIGFSVTTDQAGNVYTTGLFDDTCDFDPGAGIYNLTSAGHNDFFISKLDAAGNFVWAKQFGGIQWDRATSIAVDPSGNIYTTGYFEGTVDFDPGAGTFNMVSAGLDDVFILKLDLAGNFVWAKQLGSTAFDGGRALALDASGNIYTTGVFEGTVDFDPGAGVYNLTAGATIYDIFVSKLDPAGNFIWAKQMGGASYDISNAITLDGAGNVYTAGYFYGTSDFDPGASTFNLTPFGGKDIFISKLDPSGNFLWAEQMGGTSDDVPYGIAVDGSGNVYATGQFEDTADFDPGAAVTNLSPVGGYDIFTVKLGQSVATASSEITPSNNITVFPNPSNGQVSLSFDQPLDHATLLFSNTTGQTLLKKTNISGNQFAINLSEFANGIYFIKVMSDGKMITAKKIIKQ